MDLPELALSPKFITIGNTRLAYYESNTEASATVFFFHGNSATSHTWVKQFASPHLQDYRLIAVDFPMHGQSDAIPPGDNYSMPAWAALMANAVRLLSREMAYAIVGISFGASVVAEMLPLLPDAKAAVLAGASLLGGGISVAEVTFPGVDVTPVFADSVKEDQLEIFVKASFSCGDAVNTARYIADYHAVKQPFRSQLLESILAGAFSDQVEALKRFPFPLVIFGKGERIVNPDYLDFMAGLFWKGIVHKLQGASHFVHLDQPDAFNTLLATYLRDRFGHFL